MTRVVLHFLDGHTESRPAPCPPPDYLDWSGDDDPASLDWQALTGRRVPIRRLYQDGSRWPCRDGAYHLVEKGGH